MNKLKQNQSQRKIFTEQGVLFIEFALVAGLLITIVYGLGQQFTKSLREMEHRALVTELLMGPQERTLAFDTTLGEVVELSSITVPTLTEAMDTIGNFFRRRAPSTSFALFINLTHLHMDPEQGTITAVDDPFAKPAFTYYAAAGSACESDSIQVTGWLKRYSNSRLTRSYEFSQANLPATIDDNKGRFGSKLYDIDNAGVRIRRYEALFPLIFAVVCSELDSFGTSSRFLTYYTIVPRRHVN